MEVARIAAFPIENNGNRDSLTGRHQLTSIDLVAVSDARPPQRPQTAIRGKRTPHMAQIRLLIADDRVVTRSGLVAMSREAPGLDVVGVAQDVAGVLAAVDCLDPDVVLLNLRRLSGEGLRRLAHVIGAHVSIIVLWCHDSAVTVQDALRAKAAGFMALEILQEEFASVIALVDRGCAAYLFPRERIRDISDGYPTTPVTSGAMSTLTSRESDVLRLLAGGMTNKQIGSALHIAENTVKKHVHRAMNKLSASSRVEAALLVSRLGPLDLTAHGRAPRGQQRSDLSSTS
ncbi:DNA-binding response regulator [Streptomyces spectabilis]|uniref:DNA-binding response regulator n=2 Tax=Streptomyces spectabilis TaxID=68270 RepID=A0A5P2X617_STRST|nr:DNA-binding response regulator [Streptomyces spectabilis]